MSRILVLITAVLCIAVLWLSYLAYFNTVGQASGATMHDEWNALGSMLQGIGACALAVIAAIGGGLALIQHLRQQRHERDTRDRETDLDVAKLQARMVDVLRLLQSTVTDEREKAALQQQTLEAQVVLEATLRHLLAERPSLARARTDAIRSEMERLRNDIDAQRR